MSFILHQFGCRIGLAHYPIVLQFTRYCRLYTEHPRQAIKATDNKMQGEKEKWRGEGDKSEEETLMQKREGNSSGSGQRNIETTPELIQKMVTLPHGPDFFPQEFKDFVLSLPVNERLSLIAQRKIYWNRLHFAERKICLKCWTKLTGCICGLVKKTNFRHNFLLYMHYKEFGRQTNTGKILGISSENARIFLSGIPEEEAEMLSILKNNPKNSFVLFPSLNSISVAQFLSRFDPENSSDSKGKEKEKEGEYEFPSLNIVVLDGTWNQAKHLAYNIPEEVPRVHVDPTSPSLFLLRKQTRSDRICTLEAATLLIDELENFSFKPNPNPPNHDLFHTMLGNLKLSVDSVLRDKGKEPVYGNEEIIENNRKAKGDKQLRDLEKKKKERKNLEGNQSQ